MKSYFCHCGHEVVAEKTPAPIRWNDGHVCYFEPEQTPKVRNIHIPYFGWEIQYIAGHWYAMKFGVRINANSKEAIIEMIDRRRKKET